MKFRIRSQPLFWTGIVLLVLSPFIHRIQIHTGLFFNKTASEPIGIYREVPIDTLQIGDYVVIQLPAAATEAVNGRDWIRKDEKLLKTVSALPGDTYLVTNQEILVNGTYIGPVSEVDHSGLPLPQIRGKFTVQAQYFLPLASRKPNSFDGRYFGDIPQSQIISKVVPLITIPEEIL